LPEETQPQPRHRLLLESFIMKPGCYERTPETRAKMRAARLGKHHSKETIKKMRLTIYKKQGIDITNLKLPWKAGVYERTPEIRAKYRAARLGKHHTQETIEKIRLSKRGVKRKLTEDEKRALEIDFIVGGIWYGNVDYYTRPRYCELWTKKLRERVRAFFNYRCVECGTKQTRKRKLSVHHVNYNKKTCCDGSPRLLVALCTKCHSKTNINRTFWSNHFTNIINISFGGKCYMSEEEYDDFRKQQRISLFKRKNTKRIIINTHTKSEPKDLLNTL
jgi:hypothetical protein